MRDIPALKGYSMKVSELVTETIFVAHYGKKGNSFAVFSRMTLNSMITWNVLQHGITPIAIFKIKRLIRCE